MKKLKPQRDARDIAGGNKEGPFSKTLVWVGAWRLSINDLEIDIAVRNQCHLLAR